MKILAYSLLVFLLSMLLPVSAFAEEVTDPEEEPVSFVTEADGQNITVNVTLPSSDAGTTEDPTAIVEENPAVQPLYTVAALDEGEAVAAEDPDQQTMKDVVLTVLGEYTPRTQTVTEYLSDGSAETYTEIVPGVAGMDWEWISGSVLFGMVLFCFLKLVGVLLKNG